MADLKWYHVALGALVLYSFGNSDQAQGSNVGNLSDNLSSHTASIAAKVSEQFTPATPAPDVSAAPTGAPTSTDYETLLAYCQATYTGTDWVHPYKSAGECRSWAKGKAR